MKRMDDEPVSPLCLTCADDCNDQLFGHEGSCGLCCGGLEAEQDVARDEDAVLDDVVLGFEIEGKQFSTDASGNHSTEMMERGGMEIALYLPPAV